MRDKILFNLWEIKHRILEFPERYMWPTLAALLPRKLVYYASIRLMAHATTGKYSSQIVPDLTAMDALQRWYPAPAASGEE